MQCGLPLILGLAMKFLFTIRVLYSECKFIILGLFITIAPTLNKFVSEEAPGHGRIPITRLDYETRLFEGCAFTSRVEKVAQWVAWVMHTCRFDTSEGGSRVLESDGRARNEVG